MAGTIEINGTGGILEGNLDDAIINVNTDPVLTLDGSADYLTATSLTNFRSSDSAGAISAWVKIADGTSNDVIVQATNGNDNLTMWHNGGDI